MSLYRLVVLCYSAIRPLMTSKKITVTTEQLPISDSSVARADISHTHNQEAFASFEDVAKAV
jgi:hypothetical protein